jgi:hypothetical protein
MVYAVKMSWKLMLGAFCFSQGTNERPGLMPLAMSSIITMAENTESSVEISYYEVYMDRCYDLLEPKNKEVPVLEDSEGRVQLRGLAQVSCLGSNLQQLLCFLFSSGSTSRNMA